MKGPWSTVRESSLDVSGVGIVGIFSCTVIRPASFTTGIRSLRQYLISCLDSIFECTGGLHRLALLYPQVVCACSGEHDISGAQSWVVKAMIGGKYP